MESILKSLTTQSQNRKSTKLLFLMVCITIILVITYYAGCAIGQAIAHAHQ